MVFHILTIFPEFFDGPFRHGVVAKAAEAGLVSIQIHDLRTWTYDRHRTVDDRPFGGGEGMLLKPAPIFEAVESIWPERNAAQRLVLLSAQGRRFDQEAARRLSQFHELFLICGRYEGVDERVGMFLADREISIGDYVLSGGELGAAVIVDTVTRLIPGAVGNEASTRQESFVGGGSDLADKSVLPALPDSTCGSGGLLDYPHYTRPADFRGMKVPEVLVNGNHEEIKRWRRRSALEKTVANRPDLIQQVRLSEEDRELLNEVASSEL